MRIAITGAHLVGKTTLAEKLQESLLHYELYAEPYHELGEMGYIFSESPTSDEYIIQLEHSIKQIENSENDAIFDRCPLDFLAYTQAVDYTYNSQSIFNKVQKTMNKIDLLVFVPIEIPDVINCSNFDLLELREDVNDIIRDNINDFDIETLEVTGNLPERLNLIQKKIQSLKSQ